MSGHIKFQNEANGTQLPDLKDMSEKLNASIEQEQQAAQPAASGVAGSRFAGSSMLLEGLVMAVIDNPIVHGLGMAKMVYDMSGSSRPEDKPATPAASSMFVGNRKDQKTASKFFVQLKPAEPQTRPAAVSLMPSSAADQKLAQRMSGAANTDLVERANLSRMSLTGQGAGGTAGPQVKGVVVPKNNAPVISMETRKTLDSVEAARKGPMSVLRMEDGLKKGHDTAQLAVNKAQPEVQKFMKIKQQAKL